MNAETFDLLATPEQTLLERGYIAVGLVVCIFNDKYHILMTQESEGKQGIKATGEWGIPSETCKRGERLRDTTARFFKEELHTTNYSKIFFDRRGYFETNFIDDEGLARVLFLYCTNPALISVAPVENTLKSYNEIGKVEWTDLRHVSRYNLRRGMGDIFSLVLAQNMDRIIGEFSTPLGELLVDANTHGLGVDFAPHRL